MVGNWIFPDILSHRTIDGVPLIVGEGLSPLFLKRKNQPSRTLDAHTGGERCSRYAQDPGVRGNRHDPKGTAKGRRSIQPRSRMPAQMTTSGINASGGTGRMKAMIGSNQFSGGDLVRVGAVTGEGAAAVGMVQAGLQAGAAPSLRSNAFLGGKLGVATNLQPAHGPAKCNSRGPLSLSFASAVHGTIVRIRRPDAIRSGSA